MDYLGHQQAMSLGHPWCMVIVSVVAAMLVEEVLEWEENHSHLKQLQEVEQLCKVLTETLEFLGKYEFGLGLTCLYT